MSAERCALCWREIPEGEDRHHDPRGRALHLDCVTGWPPTEPKEPKEPKKEEIR